MGKINKTFALFLTLIIAISCLSLLTVKPANAQTILAPPVPVMTLVDAQSSLQNFATAIAAADGKVFTIDNWGIVNCFNAQTGKEVWSSNVGGYTAMPQSLVVYNGSVYAASRGGVDTSLDENNGKMLLQFQSPVSSSFGEKAPPSAFSAGDDCVFVGSDGFAAYNASTGNLLWEWPSATISAYPPHNVPLASMVWPFDNNVFIAEDGVGSFYRINPENASSLWSAPGYSSSPPLYSAGQVILWNDGSTSQGGTNVVSVNASSGKVSWNFNVGSSIYQPVVSKGLLLFAGFDGDFYALNLANGILAWKTPIEPKGFASSIVSTVQVDAENQRLIWGFMNNQSEPARLSGSEKYAGVLFSLDMTSGKINGQNKFPIPVTSQATL